MREDDGEGVGDVVMEFEGAMGGFDFEIGERVSDGEAWHFFD